MSSLKIKYIIASALQLVCIVFWFIPACTIVTSFRRNIAGEVIDIYTETNSLVNFFEGAEFLAVISIVGLILSLVLLVLPVIKSTETKKRRLIYSKISAVYSLFLLLASFFFPYFESTQYYDVGSEFEFGIGGILFVIFNIALFVFLFVISSESKKLQLTLNLSNVNNNAPQGQNPTSGHINNPTNVNNHYKSNVNNGNTPYVKSTDNINKNPVMTTQTQNFKFCASCGNKVVSTAQFCNKCGSKF